MNKKFLTLLALAPFVFVSCGSEPPAVKKVFSTAVSTSGTLDSFDRVTVAVRGENLAPLSFKMPGRIAEVFVRAGDTVEPGQILARLDSAEGAISEKGYASVASNLASVEAAMKTLSALREETARADAANASVRVKLAEKDLELAQKNLENTRSFLSGSSVSASDRILQAETALSAAKSELENTKSLLSERETALKEGALSAMAGAFVVARSGRDFSDAILGVTEANKHKNDGFETYLWARDSSTVANAEARFRAFEAKYSETYLWYYSNVSGKSNASFETVRAGLDRAAETLKLEREALHAVKTVLENSVAASGVLPESLLSELKTKADATLSGLESAILSPDSGGIEGSTKAIASFEKDRTLRLSALTDSVRLAETSLDLAKTGKSQTGTDEKRSLEALEIAVEMKRGELELAKKEAEKSVSGIAAARAEGGAKTAETGAKVSEAAMARDLAQESAEAALLRAPFAGVVLERFFDPGVVVNAGTPVLSVSSPKKMKAEISFDSKKTPLSEGGELSIRSVKTGETFTGTLLLVSKTDSVSGSKRKAEVAIPDGMAEIGDRVTVVLSPSSENSSSGNSSSVKAVSGAGVLIPKSAIVTRYSVPAAFVIEGGIARLKTVRVLGTDSQSALVEGIPVGSRIITAGKDSILDGERVGE